MAKFKSFGLKSHITKALNHLRFKKPTPIQSKIIPMILEGKDIIACAKTGSGKTLAYLLPIISQLHRKTEIYGARLLVLVPTRELALQTAQVLKKLLKQTDLTYSLILGGHDYIGQFESLSSNPDIIISTPGRLMEILTNTEFSLKRIQYFVLDEADKLFEKGYKEQIEAIVELVGRDRQTILLSATIPESVKNFGTAGMREYQFCKLDSEYTLSDQLEMHFLIVKSQEKVSLLVDLLKNKIEEGDQTIVFTSSKHWVDLLEFTLGHFDIEGCFLYGDLDQEARNISLDRFRSKKSKVMVVTDLCARGIDIPDVQNVINLDFPMNIKTFIHRCGRTARANKSGRVFCLFTPSERPYIYEVDHKIERELVYDYSGLDFENNKVYLGIVKSEFLEEILNSYILLKKKSLDLQKLEKRASNSDIKFKKTRFSWSKKAFYKMKDQLEI